MSLSAQPAAYFSPRCWPRWPLYALFAVLFLGPLLAPLLQATGLPLLAGSGALARDLLAHYVCPTPAKSYVLLGFPMAVCARCWGATIGIWLAYAAFLRAGQPVALYRALAWPRRLAISVPPLLLWAIEIHAWPMAPLWLLLLNGAFAGFWAGLLLCSVWPGLGAVERAGK